MKPKAIIVDIDGTLANCEHRRHFVDLQDRAGYDALWDQGTDGHWYHKFTDAKWKPDWKSFNEQMINDTPNEWLCDLLRALYSGYWNCPSTNNYCEEFIFVTGREECYRKITTNQINEWTTINMHKLFMRPSKDYRPDTDIKREIYERHIKDKYDVLLCIDDRQSVVDLWRSLGLVCLQCAKGDF